MLFLANLPVDIKVEPIMESLDLRKTVLEANSKSNANMTNNNSTSSKSDNENIPLMSTSIKQQHRKVQSMISVRKDYSYKYTAASSKSKTPISSHCLDISQKSISQSSLLSEQQQVMKKTDFEVAMTPKPSVLPKVVTGIKPKEPMKRTNKPNISILERHDYDKKCPAKVMKLEKKDNAVAAASSHSLTIADDEMNTNSTSAIDDDENKMTAKNRIPLQMENLKQLTVPIERLNIDAGEAYKKRETSKEELKVTVAHEDIELTSPVVKQEPISSCGSRQQTLSTESKDSQNINKINNKINIIFQLNDTTKRKNIILHSRTPKKMVRKITIKEKNNNSTKASSQSDDATTVPEKMLCTTETQTDENPVQQKRFTMTMSMTNPLTDELTEYLFFENDVLISLQCNTISFFEFHRLNSLLKKGEPDFRLIDRINRRLHDIQVDADNKYQRLCYNDCNSLPIYIEMRARQKALDDPEMCPIAFLYCNIYYVDQRRAKYSSVHLDTVKSIVEDIKYTTVPKSSYFIMSWHEKSVDTRNTVSGIVKYKLTPNLDLAKLASIRQFPKLNYQIKQMYCGKGTDSQMLYFFCGL